MRDIFYRPIVNKLYYLGDRYLSVLHTRLRLGHCGLNYYLFIINCKESPSCICGAPREDALHFLLLCPCFAAQCLLLLTSIERHANSVWKILNLNKKFGTNVKSKYCLNKKIKKRRRNVSSGFWPLKTLKLQFQINCNKVVNKSY